MAPHHVWYSRYYQHSPVEEKIVLGQAKTAILKDGSKINVGWKEFDGDYVIYYTGQGLREMWKPNMTYEEQERANLFKQRTNEELIQEGMIARTLITDIIDIE